MILALAPPYSVFLSLSVLIAYVLVALFPLLIATLSTKHWLSVVMRISLYSALYASVSIVIYPGLIRLAQHRGAVRHWSLECGVILVVSSIATSVRYLRLRRQRTEEPVKRRAAETESGSVGGRQERDQRLS